MTDRPLNATAASLLGFLHSGPKTGWDLVATAQRDIGDFWSITQSQVYRELATMASAGLVQPGERGARDRRPYTITDSGREAFASWVAQPPDEELIRFPLLLTILFGRQVPPATLAAHIAQHRALHRRRLAEYERLRDDSGAQGGPGEGGPDIYTAATLDFGVRYEHAVLDWFDALPAEIRGPDA
jgi:DNA-binding PadR family transcriptional regulator